MSSIIQSPDYFSINGVLSSAVDLYCDTPPIPPMAKKRFTSFQFGKDEDGVFSDDSFENVPYTLRAYKFGNVYDVSDIYAFMQNAQRLEISRDEDYFYKIRTVDSITPEIRYDGARADFRIRLTLAPFRYHKSNDEIALPQGGVIVSPGTRYSKPVIRLQKTGSDQATVTTNGQQLKIFGAVSGALTIDSDRMLVYKTNHGGVNTAVTQYTDGPLPMLAPGNNQITVSSNISSVGIVGNWRNY
ncbi:MAG: hypothetical protein K5705_06235 [Oscillospiraceae bacterium]|nr:hypothetical protein [Oscillospiraceae bacterium]